MNENEVNTIKRRENFASEELVIKLEEQINWLEDTPEAIESTPFTETKKEISHAPIKIRKKRRTLTGQYYQALLHKNPMICLLVIGGFIGCFYSVFTISNGSMVYLSQNWWWIPLSTIIIGPFGLVFLALILPFIPWIIYIAFYVLIHVGS
ncbi:hypothetical protein LCGC14_1672120 [marine sediment metagenome]|uniref:Uncharacterized protein n=1 Tax=marine sediment metagenome TaxID=412755 RepID=A0A0F9IDF6_9ZZZZ